MIRTGKAQLVFTHKEVCRAFNTYNSEKGTDAGYLYYIIIARY